MGTRTPSVVRWHRVYCAIMAGAFVPFVFACSMAALFPQWFADAEHPEQETRLIGAVMFLPFTLALIAFLAPFVLPRRPWVWVYGIVLTCLGMGGCLLPAGIALLIAWLKPETRAWFDPGPSP